MNLDQKLAETLNKTKLSVMKVFASYTRLECRNSEGARGGVELGFPLSLSCLCHLVDMRSAGADKSLFTVTKARVNSRVELDYTSIGKSSGFPFSPSKPYSCI